MAKDLDANIITQIDAQGRKPVLLFTLALTGLTLRYVAYKTNITFPHGGATVYSAKAIQFGGISQSLEGQINRITTKFDNVSKDMAAYVYSYDFEGRILSVKRIYLDTNNNAPSASTEYNEIFSGPMEQPKEIGRHWLSVTGTGGKPLKKRVLQGAYNILCRHRFGDPNTCNKDGRANLSTLTMAGTADSGTTLTLIDNALIHADDYWNNGAIEITKSGIKYKRKVKDFENATDKITFDLALPVAVDNTCTYQVWKGCDKTWETCGANNTHGPATNNTLNYGGHLHIGEQKE